MPIGSAAHGSSGAEEQDDGVLLLVAPKERKVTIATGYGAGEYMTDAMSGIIIREAILPHFKQNPPDYGGGIEAGADAIIKQMSLPADQAQNNAAKRPAGAAAAPAFGRRRASGNLLGNDHCLRRAVDVQARRGPALSSAPFVRD